LIYVHIDYPSFKETIETARFDTEIELIDGADPPEVTCQVGGFDGWVHGVFDSRQSVEGWLKTQLGM